MTHGLIIRMHYAAADPRWAFRLAYFRAMVLPRILAQTNSDFEIYMWVSRWHEQEVRALSTRIKTFTVPGDHVKYKNVNGKSYYLDFVPWQATRGLPRFDIQSGLDSDDLIAPDYMQIVRSHVDNYSKVNPGKALHLSFQPELFDARTLIVRPIQQRYNIRKGSAFLSLFQPNKNNYQFIYSCSHLDMWRHAANSIVLQPGHCWATVHGLNESTGV